MRLKTADLAKKVHKQLVDNHYQTAGMLSEHLLVPVSSVYRAVRHLRIEGVGIWATNHGYVLTKYAKKSDDVNGLRKLNGRRVSDHIVVQAAIGDVEKRWNGITERQQLKAIVAPLRANLTQCKKGMQILLSKK